jgi:hypothetical protein
MAENDVLANALADVRKRRADLEAEHGRVTSELTKLQHAERSLASLVDGALSSGATGTAKARAGEAPSDGAAPAARSGRRGPRGPRATSGKGRLRALLDEAGQDGVTQDLIAKRLADVSTPTLNVYLSGMVSSGEVIRDGDLFRRAAPGVSTRNAGEGDGTPGSDEAEESPGS